MACKYSICLYNPKEVYHALTANTEIIEWLEFISNKYIPPGRDIMLIYPCTKTKPFFISRTYRRLYKTLEHLGDWREKIHLITLSEPFGLIPEEYYKEWKLWYDCPGLFEWWCKTNNQPFSQKYYDMSLELLSDYISKFFMRNKTRYKIIIGYVRTYSSSLRITNNHTHRKMLDLVQRKIGIDIRLLPPKELIVEIIKTSGKAAWDLQGISHPIAQNYLLNELKSILSNT